MGGSKISRYCLYVFQILQILMLNYYRYQLVYIIGILARIELLYTRFVGVSKDLQKNIEFIELGRA